MNKFQTKIIFGNVLCKVHRTSLFHHKFFFMMKKTSEILVLFVDFCQARQIAETKIWWDTLSIPSSAWQRQNNFSVFKIVNFKNTEICLNKFQTKIIFGNVLCKVQNKSFSSQIFLHDEKTSEILVLFVDFAKLDK